MTEEIKLDYQGLIDVYLRLRRMKEDAKAKYEAEVAPITERMEQIENTLSGELNRLGLKNLQTGAGTVYRTTWTKVNITDWDKVADYIVSNNRFDMLEKRLAKTVVLDTLQQNQEAGLPPVPGIAIETGLKVNIRKS